LTADSGNVEPKHLRRGKAFHKKIQEEWMSGAEGEVTPEKGTVKPSGRRGRMDIFVREDGMVVVVEIKASDWDVMTAAAVRRNVRRQVRQIWDYIQSQLNDGNDVCPGVVFPKMPKDPERMTLIEQLFEEEGIPVVWDDESSAERRSRS